METLIVQRGGSLYDGSMPAFGDVLNAEEQLTVIAYFQSYWDDEPMRCGKQQYLSSPLYR